MRGSAGFLRLLYDSCRLSDLVGWTGGLAVLGDSCLTTRAKGCDGIGLALQVPRSQCFLVGTPQPVLLSTDQQYAYAPALIGGEPKRVHVVCTTHTHEL